jgi:hypothetical protein
MSVSIGIGTGIGIGIEIVLLLRLSVDGLGRSDIVAYPGVQRVAGQGLGIAASAINHKEERRRCQNWQMKR